MILERFTKQPNELLDYDISFVDWLTSMGDTELSHTAVVEDGLTLDSSLLTSGVVKVWLSGGTHAQRYKVTATVTTVGGRTKEAEILIKVKET